MMKDHWLQSALTSDVMVAELLLRLKHSSDSDSVSLRPLPVTEKPVLLPRWGNRKIRSKSTASTTAVTNGFGKDGKEHRGSPTTHLSWSGGAGSSSDGPSDLSSGCRSVKVNEGASASISSYHNLDENRKNKMRKMDLCREKMETEGPRRRFVLPDLNMTPNEEDLMVVI